MTEREMLEYVEHLDRSGVSLLGRRIDLKHGDELTKSPFYIQFKDNNEGEIFGVRVHLK